MLQSKMRQPRLKRAVPFCLLALLIICVAIAAVACEEKPTPTMPAPTDTPTAAPTLASAPTATQTLLVVPTHAPVLSRRLPGPAEEQRVDAPIVLTFDQPMDQASVQAALKIEPSVEGKIKWERNTLTFEPGEKGFARNATYRVTIGEAAKSSGGLPLQEPISFRFQTVGNLQVTDVQPAANAQDISMQADILVTFNRPVVPLTSISAQANLPQPLRFTPAVTGKGEWLNTSIYSFHPTGGLLPATTYEARIAAGLTDTTGGILPQDYVWSFSTELPTVTETVPFNNATYVAPTSPITVTFNQPMSHASAEAAFSLLSTNRAAVTGSFRWSQNSLIFTPAAPLTLGSVYTGRVAASALAAAGNKGMARDYSWTFTVVSAPRVLQTTPANGETRAAPYSQLQITFNSPIDRKTLGPNLRIIPEPTRVYSYWGESDTRVWISFGAQPSSNYQITLGADLSGRYGHKLGSPYTLSFSTRPLDAQISLTGGDRVGVYNAYTDTVAYLSFVNVQRADLALYRLTRDDFVRLNGDWDLWNKYQPGQDLLLRKWSTPLAAPLNETKVQKVAISAAEGQDIAPGLYYLEISAPGAQYKIRQMMVVTRTNLLIKHDDRELLVWAADLATGKPLANVSLSIKPPETDWVQGRTDAQGVFKTTLAEHEIWQPLFVFAQRGDELSAAITQWDNGIQPWQYAISVGYKGEGYNGVLYTDRAIYRPGQKVYFRGILRTDDDGKYGLPSQEKLQVAVNDQDGKELYREALNVSGFGTFSGEFTLSESAALGYYRVSIVPPDNSDLPAYSASFQVAEYRKPEFLVAVSTDRDAYVQGDTIQVKIESSYYFGGALQDAQVQWRLMSQNYYFQWQGKGWWDFNDLEIEDWSRAPTPYGEVITEGKGKTDSAGRLVFQLPAAIAKRTMSQLFTIEATVTDVNNQEVSERTSAIVHRGQYYIGLQPEGYVGTAGQEKKVNIITVNTEGVTVTNTSLEVVFYEHKWFSVQEKDPDGALRWTTKAQDTPVLTTTVKTDALGRAAASFVPKAGGLYRIRASGTDQRKNKISSSTYTWVSSREYTSWPRDDTDRIELVPDQKSYAPGDTAHILIPSPYQGETTALLTIERGRILEHRLLTLTGNSEQIAIRITTAHVPNIYVSVYILKGQDQYNALASFKLGYASLTVSPREKELKVTITPDRKTYAPGDKATYAIQATDYSGRPVEAEFSLALVDLSVLALTGDTSTDLMAQFYQQRPLGVQTSSSLAVISTPAPTMEAAARDAKGGGGADQSMSVRQEFPDTVYWNPALRTDKQGRASVQVPLADNLTTWRMTGQAITVDTLVGKASVDIIATKDLLIRPVTPRFFVIGDKAQLAAVVHNNTDKDIQATVALQAKGLKIQDAEQQAKIPAHGLVKVTWQTTVGPVSQVDAIFSVSGGGLTDAAKPTLGVLPVYHYSTPEVVATAGQVSGEEPRVEVIQLPETIDVTQGELTLKLEPSLAAGMRDGLTYLKTYPYDCIEQTVSRFLPNVIMYRALKKLGVRNAELEAELPKYVSTGLQRIYALQHYDGGWGWWVSDESNAYLSAYVLLGMNEAQQAGFAVDSSATKRAATFLENSLKQSIDINKGFPANARAFAMYVLAEYYTANKATGDLSRAVALYEQRASLDNYGKAYLAMTLQLLAPQEKTRLDALLSDLTNTAIRSATGAHWEEKQTDWLTMNTDVRSTAIILKMLVRIKPDQTLLPNIVRWLMAARREGRWQSTQETAFAVMALTDYMVATGELEADYSYLVGLNGRIWDQGKVTSASLNETRELQIAVSGLLRDTGNLLLLERQAAAGQTGKGNLYYSAYLRYFLPAAEVKALERGVIVSRQYTLVDDSNKPVEQVKVGDLIEVKLTIIAPNDLHYLVVEDPLPAGCEAVDTSLKTTSATYQEPTIEPVKGQPSQPTPVKQVVPDRFPYWWYFKHSELRDEKVALFATLLPRGTYEYTYMVRASLAGEFSAMPAQAYEMYFPEVFGRSDANRFVIVEE